MPRKPKSTRAKPARIEQVPRAKQVDRVVPNAVKKSRKKPTATPAYPTYDDTFRPEDGIVAEGPDILQPSKLAYRDDSRGLYLYHGDVRITPDLRLPAKPPMHLPFEHTPMANQIKAAFLAEIERRFGELKKLGGSSSLFEALDGRFRIYIRYSKLHERSQAFYGLRRQDLDRLQGVPSAICFLWDKQAEPLVVPAVVLHELLLPIAPAQDGQFKALLYPRADSCELSIASIGRFNFTAYLGWRELETIAGRRDSGVKFNPTHSRIQGMLGAIGAKQGFDIWIPANDRMKLDSDVLSKFNSRGALPPAFKPFQFIIEEIDVIWFKQGSAEPQAFFEVEHSTPIYTGLLRFNDVHLSLSPAKPKFSIVAAEQKRQLFVRALNRPTFRASGLSDLCTFLEYRHLHSWHSRI